MNWSGLGTVLANEEVTSEGRSDRGNFPVFKRPLKQWKMRITAYADRLIDDLDVLDWPESIKLIQRNWIGRSDGALIDFPVPSIGEPITVFTTRPDTMFGATYMVLAPEHPLVDELTPSTWPEGTPPKWTGGAATPFDAVADYLRTAGSLTDVERQVESRQKTGVFTGAYATNPATGASIPVFVADYVLMGYGTGAIMAVPGQDERDWEFAEVFDLPIVRTVQPPDGWEGNAFVGEGPAINSGFLDGLGVADAKHKIIEWLEQNGSGEGTVTYRLRDWLFSRQRYWGEPFPIIYDDTGLPIAVPESLLPVLLPEIDDFSPRTFADDDQTSMPEPPLARAHDWVEVTLDLGDGARTYWRKQPMPQWAGSCWYELRYLDPTNENVSSTGSRALLDGPEAPAIPEGRPLRRRCRARVLHLLRALLAQGAVRPRPHIVLRAVPASVQPGLHPRGGLPGSTWHVRRGRGGRRAQRPLLPRRGRGEARDGEDGQEPEERHLARRLLPLLRRGHAALVRDVHGPARPRGPWETRSSESNAAATAVALDHEETGAARRRRPADDATRRAPPHDRLARPMANLRFNTAIAAH